MHELELPLDPSPDPSGDAHVVVRVGEGPDVADLARSRRGMLTSLAFVIPDVGPGTLDVVRAVTDWAPPQFRVEFVLVDPPAGDAEAAVALEQASAHLDGLAWSWESVPRPAGGRAEALDAATAVATGEFVVVVRGGIPDLASLPSSLGQLWVHGGDILLVPAGSGQGRAPSTTDRDRRLAAVLGLGPGRSDAVVVLRRWVARFLLDELGRAIDPLDEVLDRIRLLEVRLVEVV